MKQSQTLTRVICFANNKGGSGKSTTCTNLAYALAQLGKRVLVIDGDMQMNATLGFFPEESVLEMAVSERNLYHAIKQQADLTDYIVPTPYEGVDMVVSSSLMSGMEYELFTKWQREFILRKCLAPVRDSGRYDYILIDAPPTLGGWVMNILCAADELIVPVEASPWGLFGLANMFEFLREVTQISDCRLLGILVTKVDTRKNYVRQTHETLREMEGVHIFETFIKVDSAIEWSQDHSMPVMAYKRSSRGAKEFAALATEVEANGSR